MEEKKFAILLKMGSAEPVMISYPAEDCMPIMDLAHLELQCDYVEVAYPKPGAQWLEGCLILIDEEGKMKGERRSNMMASLIANISPADWIAGNALIVQAIPDDFDYFRSEEQARAICDGIRGENETVKKICEEFIKNTFSGEGAQADDQGFEIIL